MPQTDDPGADPARPAPAHPDRRARPSLFETATRARSVRGDRRRRRGSRALVYNYFGDRGGLLAAVYLYHFEAGCRIGDAVDPRLPEEQARRSVRPTSPSPPNHSGRGGCCTWSTLRHAVTAAESRSAAGPPGAAAEADPLVLARWSACSESATIDWLRDPRLGLRRPSACSSPVLWRGLAGLGEPGSSGPGPIKIEVDAARTPTSPGRRRARPGVPAPTVEPRAAQRARP